MLKREDISKATERRFWEKVRRHKNGCLIWGGAVNNKGYGVIGWKVDGKMQFQLAHRVSFVLGGGVLEPELTLDHGCSRKRCVNRAHLEQVTRGENNRRAHAWPKLRKPGAYAAEGHIGDIAAADTPEVVRNILYSLASPPGFEPGSPT